MAKRVLTIRDGIVSDAHSISQMQEETWRLAYTGLLPNDILEKMISQLSNEHWEGYLAKTSQSKSKHVHVLEYADQLGGYIAFGVNRQADKSHLGEIYSIYLKPEMQGIGFGRKLVQSAVFTLRGLGMIPIITWCLTDNTNAMSFYKGLGGSGHYNRHVTVYGQKFHETGFVFS